MGKGTVRLLVAAAVVMGVLIVGGTAALIALVATRGGGSEGSRAGSPPIARDLPEPPGSHIVAASTGAGSLTLVLQGGGLPDRVVVMETPSGQVLARVGLTR